MSELSGVVAVDGPSGDLPTRTWLTVLVGLGGLALLVGFIRLGSPSLWLDEGFTWSYVRMDWGALVDALLDVEAGYALFYGVTKLITGVFGDSEVALRMLSVACFAGTVVTVAVWGRLVSSWRLGVIAGIVALTNPFVLFHARDARAYSLVMMLVAITYVLFTRYLVGDEAANGRLIWYAVVGTLAVYANVFALLMFPVHVAITFAVPRFRERVRRVTGAWVAIGVASLPLLYLIATAGADEGSWIPRYGVTQFVHLGRQLTGGWVPLALYAGAAGLAVVLLVARSRLLTVPGWAGWFLLAGVALPALLLFVISFVVPSFVPRYLVVAIPPLALLVAVGIDALRPVWARAAAVAVVAAVCLFHAVPLYTSSLEDWRAVAAIVSDPARQAQQVVFHVPDGSVPYEYYAISPSTSPVIHHYVPLVDGLRLEDEEAFLDAVGEFDAPFYVVLSHDRGPDARDAVVERIASHGAITGSWVVEGDILVLAVEPRA